MGREQGFLKGILGFCKGLVLGRRNQGSQNKNVSRIYSKRSTSYSPEKQKKLEELCEQFFEQKELITTGKIQFLGLGKVKRKLGKSWEGFKPLIHATAEEAITKYLMPSDIFIRYKDDTYVIIFSKAGPEEAQIKATLIAEEIRRLLFEHEEEELKNIEIEENVSVVKTENLRKSKDLSETADLILSGKESIKTPPKPRGPITIHPTVEIDPYEKNQDPEPPKPQIRQEKHLNCTYVPLWDVKKNILTTYLCLVQGSKPSDDPFDWHEELFAGSPQSVRSDLDIRVLKSVKKELAEIVEGGRKLFIACPVHCETLMRTESRAKYLLECQNIPDEHGRFLVFLVFGLPESIHDSNMGQVFGTLKSHCSALYAHVPLNPKIDFYLLSSWHFNAVGVSLKKVCGSEKRMITKMREFSQNAKNALIGKVFALDVPSLSVTTSAVCDDFDFLSGKAIHENVSKPNNIYRFLHQDLFADLINGQQKG